MAEFATEDLRAAVAAGVLSEAQAAGVAAMAASRRGLRDHLAEEDEPFEFFRGFAEIFITVGLCLLFAGIGGLARLAALFGVSVFVATSAVGAVLAWVFAEYFTRRRRMSLPSIALAAIFALNVAALAVKLDVLVVRGHVDMPLGGGDGLVVATTGLVAMLVYFRRFRLPFATFVIGIFGAMMVFSISALIDPQIFGGARRPAEMFFDFRTSPSAALATLVFGLCAFVAAMGFDLRDPHRVSRYSASAFWLHLLAAPALVNTVAFTLYRFGGTAGYVATALALAGVAVLALVIDRRSFLTAGLIYLGLLIGLALRSAGPGWSYVWTLLLLGAIVTMLGTWWVQIRSALLRALPGSGWKSRLPPYA